MSAGGITTSDVTRLGRTLDYLRRSIDNQTAALKDQNMLMRTQIQLLMKAQAELIFNQGEDDAEEGEEAPIGLEEGGISGGGEENRSSGLGEGSNNEGGTETT